MTGNELKPAGAIIDIGSNTIRLVIHGGPPRAPVMLLNEKVTARLGKGVAESGRLTSKAQAVALRALARFAMLAQLHGLSRIEVVATAAVRDAANGEHFLDAVRALGLNVRLLSGEEEAVTSASGVIGAFPDARGMVADLGVGSIELVEVAGGRIGRGFTMPLGTLALPALRAEGNRMFHRKVARMLKDRAVPTDGVGTLYLVGGSLRAFAKVAIARTHWPLEDPHGLELSAEAAERLAAALAKPAAQAPPLPGISASRAASLPDVAQLLRALLRKIRPKRVVFSSWGLREGLIHRSLSAPVRAQDPLLAGVAAFAGHYRVSAGNAAAVAAWCDGASIAEGATLDENLRLSAVMLALAASRLEPNLRADHAIDWAMRKRWIGLSGEDRVVLAACLNASMGRKVIPEAWTGLAPPERLRAAQGWGMAVRLCRRFCDCLPDVLRRSSLEVEAGRLHLVVGDGLADLVGDDVERDLRALAAHLGLAAEYRIV